MTRIGAAVAASLFVVVLTFLPASEARDLSFEDRVRAQERIERVYYTHQLGARLPFEQAVPRRVLEEKVLLFLGRARMLADSRVEPTGEDLVLEMERIAGHTRLPGRLLEIYAALDHDPLLVLECFVRPALTERLSRGRGTEVAASHAPGRGVEPSSREAVPSIAPSGTKLPMPRGLRAEGAVGERNSPDAADDTWTAGVLDDAPLRREQHTAVWTGSLMIVWGGRNVPGNSPRAHRYDPVSDTWSDISTAGAPSLRDGHTAVWTGQLMIVWGGGPIGAYSNSGGRYDPVADTWSGTSIVGAPSARRAHTAVWTGTRMIVWGGRDASGPLGDGASYDPATDSWSPIQSLDAPSPRDGHTAVWTGSVMIVWGGRDSAGVVTATGAVYDPAQNSWAATQTAGAPEARELHTAVWTGSVMIVWGGTTGGSATLATGGRYDPVGNFWAPTSTLDAPSARERPAAVWTGTRMLVWGGTNANSNTGGSYDPVSDDWNPISTAGAPHGRKYTAAVWTGGEMIVWGGHYSLKGEVNQQPTNTGGIYNPNTDTWRAMATPGGRTEHTSVWTGNLMLVWGGKDRPLFLAQGHRYDPLLDAWSLISVVGAPTPRVRHTALWTGTKMIVWGGDPEGDDVFTDTGGVYDPVSDSWIATSLTGAPSPRSEHTAVWTGNEMIVWGGAYLNDGARYNPVSNSWSPLPTTGAPEGRARHAAVWTGDRMVVWGGFGTNGFGINTGGRFDPVAGTWAAMTLVGAPTPRGRFAAVWTGRRLVVWGGMDAPGTAFGDGGRYDPVNDQWSSVTTFGAPVARRDPSGVWTGGRMVIWGGMDVMSTMLDDGGRYDPVNDAWTPVSTTGAPAPRRSHTAVWTGKEMIVWGGQNDSSGRDFNDGARYTVALDTDGDGVLDQYDCDPWDASVSSRPGETSGVAFAADKTTVSWLPAPGAATYDVARGLLSTLPVGGSEICLAQAIPGTSVPDAESPPQGDGFFYLVRGRNSCGPGSWGTATSGAERVTGACP